MTSYSIMAKRPKETRLSPVWQDGFDAYEAGVPAEQCPYPPEGNGQHAMNIDRKCWLDGWLCGYYKPLMKRWDNWQERCQSGK